MTKVVTWALILGVAVVVGLCLYARFETPSPDETTTTINAPASAEAPPKSEKREPQVGDVAYSTDLLAPSKKPGETHLFARLEVMLVERDENTGHHNAWIGRARLINGGNFISGSEADARIIPVYEYRWHYFVSYCVSCRQCAKGHAGIIEVAPKMIDGYKAPLPTVSAVREVDIDPN